MLIKTLPLKTSFKLIPVVCILFFGSLLITACDSGTKSNKNSFSVQQKTQKYTKDTTLKGKLNTEKQTLFSGEIQVINSKGKSVASTQIQNSSHYSVIIPAGTELPLTLSFMPDKNKKDKMISVAIYSSIKKYDINDLTTLIAKKAKSLGGYTHTNMVMAAESTVGIPDANKTSTGFRGDPTKQYGGWH